MTELEKVTLPSECVSLSRPGFGEIYSSPWSSWRWECGNRLHRFPRFVGRAENSTIVFRAFHKPSFPQPASIASNCQAATFAVARLHLFGHDHTSRIVPGRDWVQVSASAAHPDRTEPGWEPGYNL